MLISNKVADEIHRNFFGTNYTIALKITNRCPTQCRHCREFASPDDKSIMSYEVIDKVIEQISKVDPSKWVVCLQGGESILYPEICDYVIKKCKEKGITTNLYSSGWWYKEREKYFKIIKDLNPDIFTLSVNDWTVERLGESIEYADLIAEWFADDENPIKLIYSECYLDRPKYARKLAYKSCVIPYNIAPVGRAKDLIGEYEKMGITERWIDKSQCTLSGFEIETDGTIFANCCAATGGCKFGSVFTEDLNKLTNLQRRGPCNGY